MKITLEPSSEQIPNQQTVTLQVPRDDLSIREVAELLRGALVAYGFHPGNVDEIMPEEQ